MKGLWDIFVSVFQITQTHKGVQGVHTCWELQPIYFIDRDLTHHLNNNWTGMGRECKNIRPQKPRIRALLLTTAQKHLLLHSWQAALCPRAFLLPRFCTLRAPRFTHSRGRHRGRWWHGFHCCEFVVRVCVKKHWWTHGVACEGAAPTHNVMYPTTYLTTHSPHSGHLLHCSHEHN